MHFLNKLKPALLLVLALAFVPMLTPVASAQTTTIYAELGRCRTNVDHYQVQLQAGDQRAPDRVFPASVTILF